MLALCVKVTKAHWLIIGTIRRSEGCLNPVLSMSKSMSLFISQNQTRVVCVRIRYLQFNPDDCFIMEKTSHCTASQKDSHHGKKYYRLLFIAGEAANLKEELEEDTQLLKNQA